MKLVPVTPAPEAERLESTEPELAIGQWFRCEDDDKYKNALCCVIDVGTNYVEVRTVDGTNWRVHLDEVTARLSPDANPDAYINGKITEHQTKVTHLLDEIRRITAALGVPVQGAIGDKAEAATQALAVAHGTPDVKKHKNALIKAKEKTLPDLFKKMEVEHGALAMWMKAKLIPAKAELERMKGSIKAIDDRIFVVELYAGLVEQLEQIQDGEPAGMADKLHLFQRRHYMDEECLARYEAGGMDYNNVGDFDRWLCRPENLTRILPFERSIVAFRIRRSTKHREGYSLGDWIRIMAEEEADKRTFLYIRNGSQVWRLTTAIDFGAQLFPNKDDSILLNGDGEQLWIRVERDTYDGVASQRQVDQHRENKAEAEAEHQRALEKWRKQPKAKRGMEPWNSWSTFDNRTFHKFDASSVFYDDAIAEITKEATEHNRIAVVIQGLLDRSRALHPHPHWKLWAMGGFLAAIELVYDVSRAVTSGDAPNFAVYRAQLAKSIKVGSLCIGQKDIWRRAEAVKENKRRESDRRWRDRHYSDLTYYKPYGNPGPGFLARVARIRAGKAIFTWTRKSQKGVKYWEPDPNQPGWGWNRKRYPMLDDEIAIPIEELFNVSAYTAGDFRLFFDDPRTRADYLQWAAFLLPAEDYAVKRIGDPDAKKPDDTDDD